MSIKYLERNNLPRLAYNAAEARGDGAKLPAVLFCGGYRSDMTGIKAQYLEDVCAARGQGFFRFDYSAHGASEGDFMEGTITGWKNDARAVIDALIPGPVIIAGSSMGGWIALLLARELPQKVAGIVGIAAAPDFTLNLEDERLSPQHLAQMQNQGYVEEPTPYDPRPYIFTRRLREDGRANLLLNKTTKLPMPVRLIQGMRDPDVPWQTAHRIRNAIEGDVEVFLVEEGDHRLSRPQDLELIGREVAALSNPMKV
jgi:pimeloyl-ACP methyl ester carboxylesterase